MLIDTHCHLFQEYYSNLDEIIKEAQDNCVYKYISAADNLTSAKEMLSIANKYENLYIALGIHPEYVEDNIDELIAIIKENQKNKKFVAIGEIGLDYHYGKETKKQQIELFSKQLAIAEELNMPVIIHSRDATLDTINTLKKYKLKGVIHCFSGSIETALEYVKMGYLIGVGGVLTFKNSKLDEVIKKIPLEKIVLETDSPYLTPEPFRKYTNEPKYIKTIAEYLAELKEIPLEKLAEIIAQNTKELFDI